MVVAKSASPSAVPLRRHQQQQEQEKTATDNGRVQLTVSDKSNGEMRKTKNREITSRYKTASTASIASANSAAGAQAAAAQADGARRHPSPNLGRSLMGDSNPPRRALSAERRRPWPPATSEPKVPTSSVEGAWSSTKMLRSSGRGPDLLWPSSQSKQGESSNDYANENVDTRSDGGDDEKSIPVSSNNTMTKSAANGIHRPGDSSGMPPQRKGSPMRRQSTDQTENPRPPDYLRNKPELQRWPSSSGKVFGASLTRSVDLSAVRERTPAYRSHTSTAPGRAVISSGYGISSSYGSSSTSRPARPAASPLISSAKYFSRSANGGLPGSSPVSRSSTPEQRAGSRVASEQSTSKNVVHETPPKLPPEVASSRESAFLRQLPHETVLAGSDYRTLVDPVSDSEIVSSRGPGSGSRTSSSTRGTTVPARVWQAAEASRLRRLSEGNRLRSSMSEHDMSASGKSSRHAKGGTAGTSLVSNSSWSVSSSRGITAVSNSTQPPVSPSRGRGGSSPLRGIPSPTRTRPPSASNGSLIPSRIPAVSPLSFGADMRSRGKKAMTQQEEAMLLRILHNRYLQWRFMNARAETVLNGQRAAAERAMYSVWLRTSELRASVATQRIKMQRAKHFHKLKTIISNQVPQLQSWAALKQDHSISLLGLVEALEASILRVPVMGGARADVQAVKEALGSSVDVVNAVELFVKNLLPQADSMDGLGAQLAETVAQERALLAECGQLLSVAAAIEIEERSLSTHLVQLQCERSRLATSSSDDLDSIQLWSF